MSQKEISQKENVKIYQNKSAIFLQVGNIVYSPLGIRKAEIMKRIEAKEIKEKFNLVIFLKDYEIEFSIEYFNIHMEKNGHFLLSMHEPYSSDSAYLGILRIGSKTFYSILNYILNNLESIKIAKI